jgi:hypothetical protein
MKGRKEARLEAIRDESKIYGSKNELLKLWKDGRPISVYIETLKDEEDTNRCGTICAAFYDSSSEDGYTERNIERREYVDSKTIHAYHTWETKQCGVEETIEQRAISTSIIGGLLLPIHGQTENTIQTELDENEGQRTYTLICSDWREISMEGDLVEPYTMFCCHSE